MFVYQCVSSFFFSFRLYCACQCVSWRLFQYPSLSESHSLAFLSSLLPPPSPISLSLSLSLSLSYLNSILDLCLSSRPPSQTDPAHPGYHLESGGKSHSSRSFKSSHWTCFCRHLTHAPAIRPVLSTSTETGEIHARQMINLRRMDVFLPRPICQRPNFFSSSTCQSWRHFPVVMDIGVNRSRMHCAMQVLFWCVFDVFSGELTLSSTWTSKFSRWDHCIKRRSRTSFLRILEECSAKLRTLKSHRRHYRFGSVIAAAFTITALEPRGPPGRDFPSL